MKLTLSVDLRGKSLLDLALLVHSREALAGLGEQGDKSGLQLLTVLCVANCLGS